DRKARVARWPPHAVLSAQASALAPTLRAAPTRRPASASVDNRDRESWRSHPVRAICAARLPALAGYFLRRPRRPRRDRATRFSTPACRRVRRAPVARRTLGAPARLDDRPPATGADPAA